MSTRGRKQRPWRILRCVVEVKVPPSNRSDEKDLIYHVEKALFQHGKFPGLLPMPRSHHPERYDAKPRVKSFARVRQALDIYEMQERVAKTCRDWNLPVPPIVEAALKKPKP